VNRSSGHYAGDISSVYFQNRYLLRRVQQFCNVHLETIPNIWN